MEGSKLPKPSAIRAPHIKISKPLTESKLNLQTPKTIESHSSAFAMHRLKRRSKSATDFRSATTNKTKQAQKSMKPLVMNLGQKRGAEKSPDEVKPKMVKQTKLPDWDYKGRFNQLLEKYSHLQETCKGMKNKLVEFEDIKFKYREAEQELEISRNNNLTLSKSNKILSSENQKLNKVNTELEDTLANLTRRYEEQKFNFDELVTKHTSLTEELNQLKDEHFNLNNKFKELDGDHNNLNEKYVATVDRYTTLKKEHEEVFTNKQNLEENLRIEAEQNKELIEQNNALKQDVQKGEELRRKLHNTIQDLKGNIRVFCRVRPPINIEEEERLQCALNFTDDTCLEIRKSRESVSAISGKPTDFKAEFTFDKVFQPKSSQEEIFEDLAQLVQSALDGYDVCVFAYGQTGSGKTYTMQGEETPDQLGLIPRTIDLIFSSMNKLHRAGWVYEIKASFLEIYNENVRDLLNSNLSSQNLEIRFNEGNGTTVTNLIIKPITSAGELKILMLEAQKNRAVATTDFNEHSSRSHAVTKIYLQGFNEKSNICYTGSINLVDLAGSESAKTSSNERLIETKNINKSLSTLGNVMLALYNKDKHIPYRNSKLTYLLQSCLGGNSKTLMVVNIAPFEECYAESISSLRFAAKVKEVKTGVKRNKALLAPPTPVAGNVSCSLTR